MARVDIASVRERLKVSGRDPRVVARVVLGVLVAANLAAAVVVLKPWAGSAEDLERQAAALSKSMQTKRTSLERLRGIVNKVQSARGDGDRFMDGYLLSRQWVSSRLLRDLDVMARKSGIRQREVSFAFEPIEGSDTMLKATTTANYEGTYADLVHFLNLLDRSPRLLIVESLGATPQPQGMLLNVTMKLNSFVREGGVEPPADSSDEALLSEREAPQREGMAPRAAPAAYRQPSPPASSRFVPVNPPQPNVPVQQPGMPEQMQMQPQPPMQRTMPPGGPRLMRERLRQRQQEQAPPTEGTPQ